MNKTARSWISGIVADEHEPSAKLLDCAEMYLRRVVLQMQGLWLSSGTVGRLVMTLAGVVMTDGLLVMTVRSVLSLL